MSVLLGIFFWLVSLFSCFLRKQKGFPSRGDCVCSVIQCFRLELSISEEVMDPKHPAGLHPKGAGMLMALDVENTSKHRVSAGTALFDLCAGKMPLVV